MTADNGDPLADYSPEWRARQATAGREPDEFDRLSAKHGLTPSTPNPDAPTVLVVVSARGDVETFHHSRQAQDGALAIGAADAPRVQALLRTGMHHEHGCAEDMAAMESRVSLRHVEIERSRSMASFFWNLLDAGPEAVKAWLDDFEANRDRLRQEVEEEAARALHNDPAAVFKVPVTDMFS